jgi:hypothetical protein
LHLPFSTGKTQVFINGQAAVVRISLMALLRFHSRQNGKMRSNREARFGRNPLLALACNRLAYSPSRA